MSFDVWDFSGDYAPRGVPPADHPHVLRIFSAEKNAHTLLLFCGHVWRRNIRKPLAKRLRYGKCLDCNTVVKIRKHILLPDGALQGTSCSKCALVPPGVAAVIISAICTGGEVCLGYRYSAYFCCVCSYMLHDLTPEENRRSRSRVFLAM